MTDQEVRQAVSEQVVQSAETIESLRIEVVRLEAALKGKNHDLRSEALGEDDYAKLAAVKDRLKEMQTTDEDHKWLIERLETYHRWGCYPNELLAEQRLEISNLKCAREISDGDGCDVMVSCKDCGLITRYQSQSSIEVEDLRVVLKDRDAKIALYEDPSKVRTQQEMEHVCATNRELSAANEKLKARLKLYELRKDVTG